MGILGIYASQISGHLANYAYESISTVTVGSAVSSISFTSIPSTYKHLQIRLMARDSRSIVAEGYVLQFNGDTAGNYSDHLLYGDGSSAASVSNVNSTYISPYAIASANAGTNTFGVSIVDVLDYQNTNKYKTIRALTGTDNNGNGSIGFSSGNWRNTSAISSILIGAQVGNWQPNSKFALYGIKG